jgi:hypothetical protein
MTVSSIVTRNLLIPCKPCMQHGESIQNHDSALLSRTSCKTSEVEAGKRSEILGGMDSQDYGYRRRISESFPPIVRSDQREGLV